MDIWSTKEPWVDLFKETGLLQCFKASSFSSDHGMVKPSPHPFNLVVQQIGVEKSQCLVIGDSEKRDVGGAKAAGLDCILVGKQPSSDAIHCYLNLIEFTKDIARYKHSM